MLAPPLVEWWRRRPGLDPVRWSLASIADDVAYGAGVWAGCLRARSFGPLVPSSGSGSRGHPAGPMTPAVTDLVGQWGTAKRPVRSAGPPASGARGGSCKPSRRVAGNAHGNRRSPRAHQHRPNDRGDPGTGRSPGFGDDRGWWPSAWSRWSCWRSAWWPSWPTDQQHRIDAPLSSARAQLRRTDTLLPQVRAQLAVVHSPVRPGRAHPGLRLDQLAADQAQLARAQADVFAQGVSISDLDTCLSGVEKSLNQISLDDQTGAAATLSGVASNCKEAAPS